MKNQLCRLLSLAAILAGWLASTPVASADPRDATNVLADPRTNISDVYAFVNPNNGNVVLAMTVNGLTVSGIAPVFAPGCLYQFKIDNTGDFIEDLVIQFIFDKPLGPASAPTQNFTVVGPIKPVRKGGASKLVKTKETPFTGPINNTGSNIFTTGGNGLKVFCGSRDDPFFFDDLSIREIVAAGAPVPAQTRAPGIDYYAGLNCSVIAIEVPPSLIVGNLAVDQQMNLWATTNVPTSVARSLRAPARGEPPEIREGTSKSFLQQDRGALAHVSTFLITEEDKNAFSAGQPKDDAQFFASAARARIQRLQLNPATPGAIAAADQLLASRFPNVLRLLATGAGASAPDNGRLPTRDVIDQELALLTLGVLTSDNVNANDVPFLTDFPFFAPPHGPTQGVPPRD